MPVTKLTLGDTQIDVIRKDIKNVHLSVYPPAGRVRISAPQRISIPIIRAYAISRLPWIRQQQKKIRQQPRESRREYVERESHYFWGKRYLLKVLEKDAAPSIELKHSVIRLTIRPRTSAVKRAEIMEDWYRQQIRIAVEPLITKWQKIIGVKLDDVVVRKMKTKWGSCTPARKTIRLNSELAKKPLECLEYIVVHELVHLREPTHNARFVALMDKFMPKWQHKRDLLNRLPVRHDEWDY